MGTNNLEVKASSLASQSDSEILPWKDNTRQDMDDFFFLLSVRQDFTM